jgi:hypothetical protein
MKNNWKPFILILGFLLATSCSPNLTEAEMTATQEALASPTPTKTSTPTPTSTATPTITLTPTATPVPIDVTIQDNGSTLVQIPAYGFQFEVPAGWTYSLPSEDATSDSLGSAMLEIQGGDNALFDVSLVDTSRSLERYLERRVEISRYGMGFTIHRQGITTNRYGVSLAYYEQSGEFGPTFIHSYSIFVESQGEMIHFSFWRNLNAARSAIAQIQASFQWID